MQVTAESSSVFIMTIARDTTVGEAEPVAYGIATGNRFAMVDLGDEMEDPSEIYKIIEKENAAKKKEQKKKKEKKPAPKKEEVKPVSEKPAADDQKENTRGRGRGGAGGRGRGGRGRGDFGGGNRGGDTSCRLCHQEGHFVRECPDKPAERDTSCRNCKEEGHFARECPEPRKEDDRRPRYDRNRDDGDRPPRMQDDGEMKGEDGDGERRRGGYRGGSRGRGGRGGSGYRGNRDTNRQFDRRSGDSKSTVKGAEKREGGGAHNWGNSTEEPQEAAAEAAAGWGEDTPAAEPSGFDNVQSSGFDNVQSSGFDNIEPSGFASGFDNIEGPADPVESGDAAPAEEPEPDQMTFEEYQKQLAESKMKKEFNIRKAGENEDDGQWKNFAPLKKGDVTAAYMGGEEEYEKIIVRGGRKKNFVDVNVKFAGASRRGGGGGRGGRDDRGGDRRGMPRDVRDGDFGPRSGGSKGPKAANVDIEDVNAFPSLS